MKKIFKPVSLPKYGGNTGMQEKMKVRIPGRKMEKKQRADEEEKGWNGIYRVQ